MLIRLSSEQLYGFADWAAGYTNDEPVEEIQGEIQEELDDEIDTTMGGIADQWSVFQKAALFGVIVGAVALYLRMSKRRNTGKAGYRL